MPSTWTGVKNNQTNCLLLPRIRFGCKCVPSVRPRYHDKFEVHFFSYWDTLDFFVTHSDLEEFNITAHRNHGEYRIVQ